MDTTRPSLLLRIRDHGDADAWRTFNEIYRPMLWSFARSRGLSDADAEDVTQHCLSAVSSHISEFEYDPGRGRFKSWLRTLANNHIRNLGRARRARSAESGDFERPQAREPEPDEEFERLWQEEHLRHCLLWLRAEVGESTFLAFEQYVIDGRSAEEVAGALGLRVNNLYTMKWRLTQKIAERMRELTGDGP